MASYPFRYDGPRRPPRITSRGPPSAGRSLKLWISTAGTLTNVPVMPTGVNPANVPTLTAKVSAVSDPGSREFVGSTYFYGTTTDNPYSTLAAYLRKVSPDCNSPIFAAVRQFTAVRAVRVRMTLKEEGCVTQINTPNFVAAPAVSVYPPARFMGGSGMDVTRIRKALPMVWVSDYAGLNIGGFDDFDNELIANSFIERGIALFVARGQRLRCNPRRIVITDVFGTSVSRSTLGWNQSDPNVALGPYQTVFPSRVVRGSVPYVATNSIATGDVQVLAKTPLGIRKFLIYWPSSTVTGAVMYGSDSIGSAPATSQAIITSWARITAPRVYSMRVDYQYEFVGVRLGQRFPFDLQDPRLWSTLASTPITQAPPYSTIGPPPCTIPNDWDPETGYPVIPVEPPPYTPFEPPEEEDAVAEGTTRGGEAPAVGEPEGHGFSKVTPATAVPLPPQSPPPPLRALRFVPPPPPPPGLVGTKRPCMPCTRPVRSLSELPGTTPAPPGTSPPGRSLS